ncbi:MAG: PrsW family intramembrane metalloprotease [Treponema sp.]|jgi:RsiW-degrading membrane proteinase PrsW (M82 family)|nr:PrsW family intramembrane metalloprotease [Treponema sp.]
MNGLPVLLLLILTAALPVILLFFWYHRVRCPLSTGLFLLFLLGGATSMFIALILQALIPPLPGLSGGLGQTAFNLFCRIAATEETSRLLVFLILFPLARIRGENSLLRGRAAGLAAGLGFALVESAAYGASDAGIALLRTVTSAPLHGACGARVGEAAVGFREGFFPSLLRFLSAVAIHGAYNFMIRSSGVIGVMAVLAAFCALASSILSIRAGLKNGL